MEHPGRMLDLAARLALRAAGDVEPNPLVGAVITRDGAILGLGHHRVLGGLHAETEALADCRRRGNDPRGATLYVTLEPCNHTGKQPPCVDAILAAGISRVVYARPDPNPVAAGGATRLIQSGVRAELCPDSPLATGLAAPVAKRVTTGLPWTIAKWAQTIDGRVATRTGESKWISGERARARVHRLRSRVDAIITGIGTVLADDPSLNARTVRRVRRTARRVVCDTDLDIPANFTLVRTAASYPTTIVCAAELARAEITAPRRKSLEEAGIEIVGVHATAVGVDLTAVLRMLAERHNATNVLIESGPGLMGSFLDAGLIDEAIVYIAPLLLGDEMARSVAAGRIAPTLAAGLKLRLVRVKTLGGDVELTYRRADAT